MGSTNSDASGTHNAVSMEPASARGPLRGDIAIIGLAGLFPGAPTLETFWQNIVSKVDATTDAPPEAWDEAIFYDPASTATDRVYCKRGGFLGPIARFNPLAHGIVPLAVEGGEPDQWLALQLAHDALADAGYLDKPKEKERTAVILGKGTYINRGNLSLIQHGLMVEQIIQILRPLHPEFGEADFEAVRDELKRSLPPLNTDTASALIPNVIAGRIANRLDLMGPSYTVDGACASSLLAVEIAMRDLLTGQCDLALVGGSQVTTPIPILTLFCQLNALSHRQQLRAFDADADGTVLGEGIGMVVLKRREDAERDGDRIYAVIKGVGSASDGRAVSVMAPRFEGEVLAVRRAYEMAGIDPRTVELIEAHGTATAVGDVVEVQALREVLGPRTSEHPRTALGTVKSMIGHTMPAAGIAGLIKAALALYHKTLPPTLNVDTPNPKLELDQTPLYINTETRPWIHGDHAHPRRAGVNAFGFGGINAHVVLEEHPSTVAGITRSYHQHWDSEACILRAASREGLLETIDQVRAYLEENPSCHLKDVAYTLNVTAPEGPWRIALVASTVADLLQKLGRARQRLSDPACETIKDVRGIYFAAQPLSEHGRLAFLFPGEGSQYVNMLADLCIHFPEVRTCYDQIDRVYLDHERRFLPSDVIFPCPSFSKAERAAAAQRLWRMDSAMEAVLTANHALFVLLTRLGVRPDIILGHSTGEFSAMRESGMVDLSDEDVYARFLRALNRTYEREVAQDGLPRAALLAIGADRAQVETIMAQMGDRLYIAMDNCHHQTVVAGAEDAVQQAAELARARGFIHEFLQFDRAYHTPLFEPYAGQFMQIYADLPMSAPAIETYSCTTVAPYPHDSGEIRNLALVEHWVKPVEFSKTIQALYDDAGVRIFVEVGPKGNLTAFVDDILGDQPYLAVPANLSRRTGIASLNHMVAMLAAHGVAMDLDYLYSRRAPQQLPILGQAVETTHPRRPDATRKLATGWPALTLSKELNERLRSLAIRPDAAVASAQSVSEDVPAGIALPGEPWTEVDLTAVAADDLPAAEPMAGVPRVPVESHLDDAWQQVIIAQPDPLDLSHLADEDAVHELPQPEPAAARLAEPRYGGPELSEPAGSVPVAPSAGGAHAALSAWAPAPSNSTPGYIPAPAATGHGRVSRAVGGPAAAQAMHAYLYTMDQFMAMQEAFMQSYVQSARGRREQVARVAGSVDNIGKDG